jgi:hypothetical protein
MRRDSLEELSELRKRVERVVRKTLERTDSMRAI